MFGIYTECYSIKAPNSSNNQHFLTLNLILCFVLVRVANKAIRQPKLSKFLYKSVGKLSQGK